ncbi:MAG: hypothetical protein LBB59_01120 [Campylobacteraceae bacterium]|jgi:hypothetical protein|nr:hypothetical protein [Campylobacteraceae bacterium]
MIAYEKYLIYEDDYFKYDLGNYIKRRGFGSPNRHWAIDRERDILGQAIPYQYSRDENVAEISKYWEFYWKTAIF